jgi:rRNA-processing protein FCF1
VDVNWRKALGRIQEVGVNWGPENKPSAEDVAAKVGKYTLDALVTYDKRMRDVARSVGVPAKSPGLAE